MSPDLSQTKLLDGLTAEQRERIARIGAVKRFSRGELIFREDSPGEELFFVMSGRVDILIKLKSDEQRIATHQAGDSFGEFAAMDCSRRSATAMAATDVEVVAIQGPTFYRLLSEDTAIGYAVMKNLCTVLCDRLKNANLQWRNAIYWG